MTDKRWEEIEREFLDADDGRIGGEIRLLMDLIHARGVKGKSHAKLKKDLLGFVKGYLKSKFSQLEEEIRGDWEGKIRNGNFYKKMPNGKYFSMNSLSELKDD